MGKGRGYHNRSKEHSLNAHGIKTKNVKMFINTKDNRKIDLRKLSKMIILPTDSYQIPMIILDQERPDWFEGHKPVYLMWNDDFVIASPDPIAQQDVDDYFMHTKEIMAYKEATGEGYMGLMREELRESRKKR